MNRTLISVMVAALALGGCRGEKKATDSRAMPGMDTMSGMAEMGHMKMRADSLMPAMQLHLDSLASAPAFQLAVLMTAHEALASQMLDAMGGDMTAMGMKTDSAWQALSDSVRRDLADLPALGGALLEQLMHAHVARMRRLLVMHKTMMGAGKTR
jgi:hypothetical protein